MNTREVGKLVETAVCGYLSQNGIIIKERNFRCRQGEVDLIGYDGEYLVFFEVKYRKSGSKGSAAEAVDSRKQKRICRTADYYRLIHGCPDDTAMRFDVVAVDGNRIEWYKNAFDHRTF